MTAAAFIVPDLSSAQRQSLLGRTNPLVKLGIALAWLVGLGLTLDIGPALILIVVAVVAGLELGAIAPATMARRLGPLLLAAVTVALTNLLFSTHNSDPAAQEVARLGPLRLTEEGLLAAAGLAARVGAIVSVGTVFVLTTDATRLMDALVQQGRISPRFAYGLLAAYQAVPRLAEDLDALRAARRLRGLRPLDPSLLVGLLIRAVRHADQLSIAMDARGFGPGRRTSYRPIGWTRLDAVVGGAALLVLIASLIVSR